MKKSKDIVLYPDEKLRCECDAVDKVSPEVLDLAKKLKEQLLDAEDGVGLSAPQVGESKRVIAIADNNYVHIYINPEIIGHEEEEKTYPQLITKEREREDFFEGCLSFPGLFGTVKRWLELEVKYQVINENKELKEKQESLTGFMAIVFQHELDHLNGVLFVDRIKEEGGDIYKQTNEHLELIDLEEVLKKESKS